MCSNMRNLFKRSNYRIIGAALAVMLLVTQQQAFAVENDMPALMKYDGHPVAYILHANCDTGALPEHDNDKKSDGTSKADWEKSCIGKNITLDGDNPFKVKIYYDAINDQKAAIAATIFGSATWFLINAAIVAANNPYEVDLGGSKYIFPVTTFRVGLEGDKACVYVNIMGLANFKVVRDGIVDLNPSTAEIDQKTEQRLDALPVHCIYAPLPRPLLKPPSWGGMISKVCTDYDSSASNFRYPLLESDMVNGEPKPNAKGKSRSFSGVVVQCIEETMNNIFTYKDGNNQSFFSKMQSGLITAIRGLLALYVIFFGYEFVTGKKGIKDNEWHWFALKFALVVYFAAGSGMADLLPKLQTATKELSLIVMEANASDIVTDEGLVISEDTARSAMETTQNDFEIASQKLADARVMEAKAQKAMNQGASGDSALISVYNAAVSETAVKLAEYKSKLTAYNLATSNVESFGYKYCDFRDIEDSEYMVDGKDMHSMRLWDMIDCKISKYLGVGDYVEVRDAPQILLIAIGSFFSHFGIGLLIFALTIVILIFIMLIVIRVVHIYIMSFIALILLVYISPLIIPSSLFKFTKFIFDAWLKQVIAYIIMPVILFTFLSFLFSAFDMVIYDGNHHFVPMSTPHTAYENKLCLKNSSGERICSFEGVDTTDLKCDDENSLGCIYQKIKITSRTLPILVATVYDIEASYGQAGMMFLGLLKLLLVCFIAHAALGLVEEMANKITNAAGGGTALSGAPTSNPQQISNATMNKARSLAVGGAKKAGTAAKHSNDKKKAARLGAIKAGLRK
jgi:type IV secretory pathway VirB6-like protein